MHFARVRTGCASAVERSRGRVPLWQRIMHGVVVVVVAVFSGVLLDECFIKHWQRTDGTRRPLTRSRRALVVPEWATTLVDEHHKGDNANRGHLHTQQK